MGAHKDSGAFLTSKVTEKYVPVTTTRAPRKFQRIESVKIIEEGKIAREMVKSDSDDRKAEKMTFPFELSWR
jgi:predicted metal-dependent TIM-barrel fold hydrolase